MTPPPAPPVSSGRLPRICRWVCALVALTLALGVVAGGLYLAGDALFRHNADVRRWYNVLRSEPYRYEGINPLYQATDPAGLVRLTGAEDVARARRDVARAVFGADRPPLGVRPDRVEAGIDPAGIATLAPYADPALVARIDRLTIRPDPGFVSRAYVLHPARPASGPGPVFVYQQGYAATVARAAPLLRPLLARGVTVLALNYIGGYGENEMPARLYPGHGVFANDRAHFALDPLALRRYFLPILAGLNHLLAQTGAEQADMGGLSAGGWATVVFAAIEPRIRRSYPMAGAYPLYLQQEDDHPPPHEQYYRPLLQAAGYAELFVLGALGPGRGQIQFFGQYDRCCQNNRLADLYAPTVTAVVDRLAGLPAVGGGAFAVHINDTSPDHTINPDYVARILEDLEAAGRAPAAE